jgi:uncharacterized membrane protein
MWMRSFFLLLVLVPILDYLWIGLLMQNFYFKYLGHLARVKDGAFDIWFLPACLVYLLLALGLSVLVLPRANSLFSAFFLGALFGGCVYGVYDFTNLAILKDYSWWLSVVDIAWGCTVCGVAAACSYRFLV